MFTCTFEGVIIYVIVVVFITIQQQMNYICEFRNGNMSMNRSLKI